MNRILRRREDIYNQFQGCAACQKYFFDPAKQDQYAAYYNSMYLLQDSTESLWLHRKRGFASDPLLAYLEFWGLMQAVVIQQDSIKEIYEVIVDSPFDAKAKGLQAWLEARELRHICVGHPVKKDLPKGAPLTRTFMARGFGGYDEMFYEKWEQGTGVSHPRVALGALLDAYAKEAEAQLAAILSAMRTRWP